MTAIASTTVAAATSTVTFSSIPGTYDDLYLVISATPDSATYGTQPRLRLNGSTSASVYSHTGLYGDGASATSYRYATGTAAYIELMTGSLSTTNSSISIVCHILNYANTSNFKTVLARAANDKNGSGDTSLVAGLFHSTSAITQVSVVTSGSLTNLKAGSVIALYGVKKAA
jgi:hypothetical protein